MVPQTLIESLYSPTNRKTVLKRSILYEFNHRLQSWLLRSHVQLEDYLTREYYASKQRRVDELRLYIYNVCDADDLFAELLIAIIRKGVNVTLQAVIGHLLPYMPHDNVEDNLITAAELIALTANESSFGLYDIQRPDNKESPMINVKHWEALNTIFGDQMKWIDDTFFNPPLIEPPLKVKNNKNCGYYSFNEPLILGEFTDHDMPLNYTAINTLNSLEWIFDEDVMTEPEPPVSEAFTWEDKKNHAKHMEQANKVYQLFEKKPFYLAWQYDSRGRIYSHGHHVNLQSHEYKKAMLNFNHYEILTR